jgi:hypothetical protein
VPWLPDENAEKEDREQQGKDEVETVAGNAYPVSDGSFLLPTDQPIPQCRFERRASVVRNPRPSKKAKVNRVAMSIGD